MKVSVEILVPVRGNDGAEFPDERHADFERFLVAAFGGWQVAPGLVRGGWKADDGAIYSDELRVYAVAAALIADAAAIRTAVDTVKAHYAQLAVYVRYLGVNEIVS